MTPSAPGLGRARPQRGRDTRAAIVESALRLFDEQGYLGVRVEDIARGAGVSRATFYKHFAERDEILGELFAQLIGGAIPPEVAPPAEHDIEAHVVAILEASVERMLENERLARFVYCLPVRHDAVLPGGTAVPAVFSQVRDCLAEASRAHQVRDDIPVERIVEVLGRAFEAAMRDWAEHGADPRARLTELCSIVFNGVGVAGSGTRTARSRAR